MCPRAGSERGVERRDMSQPKTTANMTGKKEMKKSAKSKARAGKKEEKKAQKNPSKTNTFNTIRLRQLCAILHQCRRNLIPTRITRRQAEVNVCARDIVCVELYSHTRPRATSHKYIVCVLSQNQNRKQRKPPPYFDAGGGEGGVTEEE